MELVGDRVVFVGFVLGMLWGQTASGTLSVCKKNAGRARVQLGKGAYGGVVLRWVKGSCHVFIWKIECVGRKPRRKQDTRPRAKRRSKEKQQEEM